MSGTHWLISDTHFGHVNITKFLNEDGTKLRPWEDINEHDEALIDNWNSVVKEHDTVYHLGDVVINRKHLWKISKCNGKKRLVMGNHDIFRDTEYHDHFKYLHGSLVRNVTKDKNFILTHIPVHDGSKGRFCANVHGHLHGNVIDDHWYINVSCEQIGFTPIALEDVISRFPK